MKSFSNVKGTISDMQFFPKNMNQNFSFICRWTVRIAETGEKQRRYRYFRAVLNLGVFKTLSNICNGVFLGKKHCISSYSPVLTKKYQLGLEELHHVCLTYQYNEWNQPANFFCLFDLLWMFFFLYELYSISNYHIPSF